MAARTPADRTWFTIDGGLSPIEYSGRSDFRFPLELAERVIRRHSPEGGWVLDPFAGFGTTLMAAQSLGRKAVGFEVDPDRFEFARARTTEPSRVILDRVENIDGHDLPSFDLIFTSPPYASFSGEANAPLEEYLADFEAIFTALAGKLAVGGQLVLEISNVRDDRGQLPLAWHCGLILCRLLRFRGEHIRCNTGGNDAGPGYDHSYLMHYERGPDAG